MCCLQRNDTPLDLAVGRNNTDIVHFFIKECNQDISTLRQVCNCVALFLIVMLYSFLNQAHAWFLDFAFVREVGMCVCMCVCVRPRGH